MTKTLLAVDDSVTMRKVLEITFSGEDFQVVTAGSSQEALEKMAERPHVCVVDTVLDGDGADADGYALVKELRRQSPGAAIILLASRYAPYDQARGRDAGADDWADKPFDTQQLIDKVRKALLAREASHAAVGAPAAAAAPVAPPLAPAGGPPRPAPPLAASAGGLGRSTQPSLGGAVPGRTGTLVFGETAPPPTAPRPAAPAAPTAAPVSAATAPPVSAATAPPVSAATAPPVSAATAPPAPAPRTTTPPPPAPAAPVAVEVGAAVNGHLASKLGGLGLTPQQAEAVLALSREVVERVVWEVVPQLAETIIKEEITRLTSE